ncbi:hypothetical protein DV096_04520 [Bradymonadaceae bacterium TMQ3]|nr:hypothetical protein DV096_04520 [Bradymonadaceae bacterium TMQ3]TXC77422.1 hypothetical protein FRC91_01415 [Bradymonadales bacterium TMQ1]
MARDLEKDLEKALAVIESASEDWIVSILHSYGAELSERRVGPDLGQGLIHQSLSESGFKTVVKEHYERHAMLDELIALLSPNVHEHATVRTWSEVIQFWGGDNSSRDVVLSSQNTLINQLVSATGVERLALSCPHARHKKQGARDVIHVRVVGRNATDEDADEVYA